MGEMAFSLQWSPARDQIVPALLKARKAMPRIGRTKTAKIDTEKGGQFSYRYTDLPALLEKVMPVLLDGDLLVTHAPATAMMGDKQMFGATTEINHAPSGQWARATILGPVVSGKMNAWQAVGSALSFGMRYNMGALLALAMPDDDARATAPSQPPQQRQQEQQRPGGPPPPAVPEENLSVIAGGRVLLNQRGPGGKPIFDPTEVKAWNLTMVRAQYELPKLQALYQDIMAMVRERRAKVDPPKTEPAGPAIPAEAPVTDLLGPDQPKAE